MTERNEPLVDDSQIEHNELGTESGVEVWHSPVDEPADVHGRSMSQGRTRSAMPMS